jgi:hypothetical protein
MDLQKLIDTMGENDRRTRSNYHLTLGQAIESLGKLDPSMPLEADIGGGVDNVCSYRGYYSDLSMEPCENVGTVGFALKILRDALGRHFTGYKGGEFLMSEDTPLWLAEYGDCGRAIIGIDLPEGRAILKTKEVE